MKIVMITGSPHRHGTSALLADAFIQGAQEAGHTVFRFDAAFQELHPCRAYNHISLAFDRALKTLVSYNGGEGGEAPGLNPETLKGLAERKGASVRVYRLAATRHQKQIMLKRLRKINQEGSAYNLLGLLFPMSCQPNIMFCSQFVYAMLRLAGLHYFRKNPLQVRPTDVVEWDRRGRLACVAGFTFDGVCLHCQDSIPQMRPTAG